MPTTKLYTRRVFTFLATGALLYSVGRGFVTPAQAQSVTAALSATETMRGGRKNYVANAPIVDNLGRGFVVSGIVRRSDTGSRVSGVRIQIWAATERGGEREASNRGSVLTDANGYCELEISPIAPQFGQPHIHMAYDDGDYDSVFLRPLLESRDDVSLEVNIVLAPKVSRNENKS